MSNNPQFAVNNSKVQDKLMTKITRPPANKIGHKTWGVCLDCGHKEADHVSRKTFDKVFGYEIHCKGNWSGCKCEGFSSPLWNTYKLMWDYICGEEPFTRKRSQIPNPIKTVVQKRDGNHCRYCKAEVHFTTTVNKNKAVYDHVKPYSQGGETSVDNIVIACNQCNQSKSSADWTHRIIPLEEMQ